MRKARVWVAVTLALLMLLSGIAGVFAAGNGNGKPAKAAEEEVCDCCGCDCEGECGDDCPCEGECGEDCDCDCEKVCDCECHEEDEADGAGNAWGKGKRAEGWEEEKDELEADKEELEAKMDALEEDIEALEAEIEELEELYEAAVEDEDEDAAAEYLADLTEKREDLAEMKAELADYKADLAEMKAEMKTLLRGTYTEAELGAIHGLALGLRARYQNIEVLPVENVHAYGRNLKFDTPPVIKDGRVLVPVRAIAAAFGADVDWIAEDKEIRIVKDGKIVILRLEDLTLLYGDADADEEDLTEEVLDVAPTAMNGRTVVPLRAILEKLDIGVEWDASDKTIKLKDKKEHAEEELTAWEAAKKELAEAIDELKDDIGDLEDDLADAIEAGDTDEYDELEEDIDALQGRLDDLQDELGNLEEQIDEEDAEAEDQQEEIANLQASIDDLQERIDAMYSDLEAEGE